MYHNKCTENQIFFTLLYLVGNRIQNEKLTIIQYININISTSFIIYGFSLSKIIQDYLLFLFDFFAINSVIWIPYSDNLLLFILIENAEWI